MKKNLLLFVGNVLLLFVIFFIANKANDIRAAATFVSKVVIRLVFILSIVGVFMLLVKRTLSISNERYYKKLFNAQLIIYALVWMFVGYVVVDEYIFKEETEQVVYDVNEKRWDSTYISSHYILDAEERLIEQQAMIKYTSVDTAVFAYRCKVGLKAYQTLIDSIGEGQLLEDTSIIKLLGCYVEDDEKSNDKKVHIHFTYKGGSIINGARMGCNDKECVIYDIRINDSTVK